MNDETFTPCTKCGRPMAYCKGQCCGKAKSCDCQEYGPMVSGCIREVKPGCPYKAVIPSLTVESVSNLKDLADCFVHVSDINTTFYIDDKHRIMITWAGLVSVENYDFDANPLNLRDQIAYDAKNNTAAIYNKQGANYIFQISDINNDYMLLEDKPQINGVTLEGNKTSADLGILEADEVALVFDTVADMKASTNLVAGSYARTLGFHSVGDGGGARYHISNTGTANEMDIIAVGDLRAHLVEAKNVKQFGAYGDGTHDDTTAINRMLELTNTIKAENGTYLTTSSLNISSEASIVDVQGKIKYSGNDYAITTSNKNVKIYINKIESANGGGIKVTNGTNFSTISADYIDSYLHSLYILTDGANGIVSVNDYYGKRWVEHTNECVLIENKVTSKDGFNTENRLHNASIESWNNKYNIYANDTSTNSETQFSAFECNLETGNGIRLNGNVQRIGLYNCRVQEMFTKTDCLYITGRMPSGEIEGFGTIDPSKLKIENITTGLYNILVTNLNLKDSKNNGFYFGGGYIYKDHFVPFVKQRNGNFLNITAGDLDENNTYTLELDNTGGIYGQFNASSITDVDFTIVVPNYFGEVMGGSMMIQAYNQTHTITIKNTSNNSISWTTSGFEKSMVFFEGDRPVGRCKIN